MDNLPYCRKVSVSTAPMRYHAGAWERYRKSIIIDVNELRHSGMLLAGIHLSG